MERGDPTAYHGGQVAFHALVADASTGDPNLLGTVLSVLLVLNVFIGLFNLLPLPPLDGFSVGSIFLPEQHASKWRCCSRTR